MPKEMTKTDSTAESARVPFAHNIGEVSKLTGHSGSGQEEDGGKITNYTRKDKGTSG